MADSHLGKLILPAEELEPSDGCRSEFEERVRGSFGLISLICDLEVDGCSCEFRLRWIEAVDASCIEPLGRLFLRSKMLHHCFLWCSYLELRRDSSWLNGHWSPLLQLPVRKK